MASTLGVMTSSDDPIASLIASLRDTRLLLILDSCEHVIESVAVIAETLFTAAPSVHILATSRESLRVAGEHVHRLFPLVCPPDDANLSASDVLGFPAAQLFIERATAASGGLEFTDADASAVVDICRRLDGIPLALELAAAGATVFGLKGLAARLDDRLLLATRGRRTAMPRHQTLRATLDWSYRLPKPEQLLLNRLSIFHFQRLLHVRRRLGCVLGERAFRTRYRRWHRQSFSEVVGGRESGIGCLLSAAGYDALVCEREARKKR